MVNIKSARMLSKSMLKNAEKEVKCKNLYQKLSKNTNLSQMRC